MGYEIDFLPVGKSGPGGDAIALRIGDLYSADLDDQFVVVVDGGRKESGEALVEHITEVYSTDRVDVVVSTHLDADHIVGLSAVIEELTVGQLWMHEPTLEEREKLDAAIEQAGGMHDERLRAIVASAQQSQDLAARARELGIEIVAPFAGLCAADGALCVLGPTQDYYESLVPRFRSRTETVTLKTLVGSALQAQRDAVHPETLDKETLEEAATTTPENNSSVVTMIDLGPRAVILTADAGEEALARAADYLDEIGFDWSKLRTMQVPHHGSRANVTPSILDRYLGEKGQTDRTKKAFLSCSPNGGVLHPARRVTNAFHRRGCKVYKTAGSATRHSHDAPGRDGLRKAKEIPFYDTVD